MVFESLFSWVVLDEGGMKGTGESEANHSPKNHYRTVKGRKVIVDKAVCGDFMFIRLSRKSEWTPVISFV